jgi:hypothetical protein
MKWQRNGRRSSKSDFVIASAPLFKPFMSAAKNLAIAKKKKEETRTVLPFFNWFYAATQTGQEMVCVWGGFSASTGKPG